MKTTKIFTLGLMLASFAANAQLVLTKGNVATSATATERLQMVNTSGLAIPARGTNLQWDYSGMTDLSGFGSIDTMSYMPVTKMDTALFKNTTRSLVQTIDYVHFGAKSTIYYTNDLNGYGYAGYAVDNRQSFMLKGATGGLNDSLIIPLQDSIFATRQLILKYPVTYSSNWSFSGNLNDHFILDLPSVSSLYVNLYGTRSISRKVTDSVVGWGTLKVPYNGIVRTSTKAYSVLLVKEDLSDSVSFSVNGMTQLVLADLLTKLSITTGAQPKTSTYIFYRSGYANPLMSYEVDPSAGYDPDNTDTSLTTGIEDENAIINFQAYPNPVTQSNLNFVFNKPDNKEWIMTITNEMGQIVQSLPVSQHAGPVQMEVNLPANLANGIYFYNMADGGSSAAQGKFILNR